MARIALWVRCADRSGKSSLKYITSSTWIFTLIERRQRDHIIRLLFFLLNKFELSKIEN
jgi:hypothetical protein